MHSELSSQKAILPSSYPHSQFRERRAESDGTTARSTNPPTTKKSGFSPLFLEIIKSNVFFFLPFFSLSVYSIFNLDGIERSSDHDGRPLFADKRNFVPCVVLRGVSVYSARDQVRPSQGSRLMILVINIIIFFFLWL